MTARAARQSLVHVALWIGGAGLLSLVALAILILKNPSIPVMLIGLAGVATIGLLLLRNPLGATLLAVFVLLLPPGDLQVPGIYMAASNGAIVAALGVWLVRVLSGNETIKWNPTCLLFALYIAWGVVTLLWAPDLVEGRRKLIAWTFNFILLLLICNQVRSLPAVDRFMRMLGLMGWLMILCGTYTLLFTGFVFGTRLKSFGMNENTLGVMLIVALPGVIWPVMRSVGPRRRSMLILAITYMLCAVALIALSGSRGGAISVGLLLLTLLFFRPARKWAVGGVAVILCLFLIAPFLFDTLIQRAVGGEGGELGGRPILWEASLLFMRDHLLGAGIGNGPFRLHPYIASLTSTTNHRIDLPSHQPFLEVGVDTGLVGLIIYVCVIGSAIWSFVQSRSRWLLSPSCPDGYYLTVIGVAAAYGATWIKGGGLENHTSLIVMFALLLIPSLVQEADDRSAREGGPWPSKHRHDRG
ncbi:MAG: O-antigen ligase family protein [Proteobacteria bacterium]|nr:O-antigen ligase family protein [Pseudomonadota bacterium]